MNVVRMFKEIVSSNVRAFTFIGLLSSLSLPLTSYAQDQGALNVSCTSRQAQVGTFSLEYASTSFSGVPILKIEHKWPVTLGSFHVRTMDPKMFENTSTPLGEMVSIKVDTTTGKTISFFIPKERPARLGEELMFKSLLIYKSVWQWGSQSARRPKSELPQWLTVEMNCRLTQVVP